jgi:hypothetical protein
LGYTNEERDEIRGFITELSKDLLETYNKWFYFLHFF